MSNAPHSESPPSTAWVEALSSFLADEPQVEAIRVNPHERHVFMATLGAVDEAALQVRLEALLKTLDHTWLSGPADSSSLPDPAETGPLQLEQTGSDWLLQKPSCPTAPRFWKWREFDWPSAEQLEAESQEEWQAMAWQAAICGLGLVTGAALRHTTSLPDAAWIACYIVALIAGGWDAAKDAWKGLFEKRLDVHFLMLAVALGAVSIGAWGEGALLLFLFSTSGALEHYVMHRTHREIHALTKAAPKLAHVLLPSGDTEDRDVMRLRVGDRLVVRPDELFPVDAMVKKGETAADESTLTGEAVPIDKAEGDEVFGGTLNLWGRVEVEVSRLAMQSALQKIITLIQTAQHMKAPSQRFTDKFGTRYTALVLVSVAVMFLVWTLLLKVPAFEEVESGRSAFYRAMTLLVVMSPCALVLSIPSAILAAIAWGARRGILFRGGAAIEKLAEVDVVAMDKTGTLTAGELQVAGIESYPPGRETDVLQTAVTLEAQSNHPIARAVVAYGRKQDVEPGTVTAFQSITGQGLRGETEVGVCYVGRRELVQTTQQAGWLEGVADPPLGVSEVWVVRPDAIGRVLLQDEIREGSRTVLEHLRQDGLRTVMLTGDHRSAATKVGEELGIAEVRAGLKPEDKVAAIRELTAAGHKVAMVGDGVNDAPSLAAAHVSMAMGARGSDAAMEQSDVVLMQDRIEKLLSARLISERARRIIRQNIAISLGAVLVMAIASLFGIVPLTLGVLTHEGSTVVVCLNSLRLLFVKEAGTATA
ncbi:MAG: heavy metal translocating P-type ATPase [Verrucomicrobiales bacterium]|nr:heavy metal translocating P-type ATPase [Verrucomicrobiales bacterium]